MSVIRAMTALGLTAATLALAASPSAADVYESGLEINGNKPAQRGDDIGISVSEDPFIFADEDWDGSFITLESPAFVAPVEIRQGRFLSHGRAKVRCGVPPGTYTVQMTGTKAEEAYKEHGLGRTTLTVTAAMAPTNREYCASARSRQEEAEAFAAAAERGGPGTPTLILAGAVLTAAALGGFLFFRRRRRRT
ncbi:LPXTG cell wall anchor domain-containing protein [Streptomyces sp. NPDC054841]